MTDTVFSLEQLQQIEAIKQLKYRYFRAVDTHDWQLFSLCFCQDASAAYNSGKLSAQGREAITQMISGAMDNPNILTMHQGHHPEIKLVSATEAEATWHLQDKVILTEYKLIIEGAALYQDKYRKIDGQWLHSHIGYKRIFETSQPFPEGFSVTESMFEV